MHKPFIIYATYLLSTDLAHTLACSHILTRVDYCNSVHYGAPVSSIQKLQCVQNNAARIVLQALRRSHAKPLMRHYTGCRLTQNRLQGVCVDNLTYKTLERCSTVPQPTHQPPRQRTDTTLNGYATDHPTVRLHRLRETFLFDAPCHRLELTSCVSHRKRLTVCFHI